MPSSTRLANALNEANELQGRIEHGEPCASFRATFADTVALQILSTSEEETTELADQLKGPVFELVKFTTDVLLAQLKRTPPQKTQLWRRGEPRPAINEQ